jgi:hypothetical protein
MSDVINCNYNKKNAFLNCFWLFFELTGTGIEWLDIGLPTPTLFIKTSFGAYIAYAIEGFFATEKNKKFLADIFIRLKLTFANQNASIRILPYPPNLDNLPDYAILIDKVYNLRDNIAPALISISKIMQEQEKNLKVAKALKERKETDDALFDYIRYIAYDFVRTNGKEALTREYLEQTGELGNEVLGKTKEPSTIRAKAKAIHKWIMKNYHIGSGVNNWNYKRKTKNDKEWEELRMEHLLKYKKEQKRKSKETIKNVAIKLKKEGKKPTIMRIKEEIGMSKNTIAKYLKELKEEGII